MSWMTRKSIHGVSPLEMGLILIFGVPGLYIFIKVFFGMMPVAERLLMAFGQLIVEHICGVKL